MKERAGRLKYCTMEAKLHLKPATAEMETGRVNRHRSGRPAGRVAGRVEILRPAGQAG